MKSSICSSLLMVLHALIYTGVIGQLTPEDIEFTRKGVQRMIFDEHQSIIISKLEPNKIIGMSSMHPQKHLLKQHANIQLNRDKLIVKSKEETQTKIWFGGFNPFMSYVIDVASSNGNGAIGYEFSDGEENERFIIEVIFEEEFIKSISINILRNNKIIINESIGLNLNVIQVITGKIILQMLGSGFTLFHKGEEIPKVIGQYDFSEYLDLRGKTYLNKFQSHLFIHLNNGEVKVQKAQVEINSGIGIADIRAITYENGEPFLENQRIWYTASIRGRALPHHIQGVFSLNPKLFDLKLEGIIVFDRLDGILRNEIASHLFYDRNENLWRGLTTGFSAYANPRKEKKQLLAVESKVDPRFGFSIMKAKPFGMIGDIEDPHILFDSLANKWRMLTCKNINGYKAIVLESDHWNRAYKKIAGPVSNNSTGTSIQKIGDKRYCFSGSSDRKVYVYSYPDLKEVGHLKMDLPPWDKTSGTRVWPNIVQLPEGYPFRYLALMMDRYNYPGLVGKHWSYGAIYLYHGHY